jgi:hypothetical protein
LSFRVKTFLLKSLPSSLRNRSKDQMTHRILFPLHLLSQLESDILKCLVLLLAFPIFSTAACPFCPPHFSTACHSSLVACIFFLYLQRLFANLKMNRRSFAYLSLNHLRAVVKDSAFPRSTLFFVC